MSTNSKIVRLEAENVKRLTAVEITPSGDVVIVGGRNAQGKTSVLDAIEMAFGGGKSIPREPLRRGADSGYVVAELGDITVKRVFRASGTSDVVVTNNGDGSVKKGPQAILDRLTGALTFDPLSFARQRPADQSKTLADLVGVDNSDLDAERKRVYEERTLINREVGSAKARLDAAPVYEDAPDEEVSVAQLTWELERAQQTNAKNSEDRERIAAIGRDMDKAEAEIVRLEEALVAARDRLDILGGQLHEAEAWMVDVEDVDPDPIRERIAGAETVNAKVRANRERERLAAEHSEKAQESNALTVRLNAIDAEKAARIAAATFPIPGLSLDEGGVTYQGIPFEQASSAEQLRVSVAMGAALNPELRVLLVRDGSLLDAESMALLADLAREHDLQVWLERVGDADEGAVIIEDGAVRA